MTSAKKCCKINIIIWVIYVGKAIQFNSKLVGNNRLHYLSEDRKVSYSWDSELHYFATEAGLLAVVQFVRSFVRYLQGT